jgi:hypothetical protein
MARLSDLERLFGPVAEVGRGFAADLDDQTTSPRTADEPSPPTATLDCSGMFGTLKRMRELALAPETFEELALRRQTEEQIELHALTTQLTLALCCIALQKAKSADSWAVESSCIRHRP